MRYTPILAALCIPLLGAAAPQRPTAGETIDVSIVNVDVFVTDRSGNRVRGLTKDDFEVFENGVKQPVTHFAEYAGENGGTVGVETDERAASPSPDGLKPVPPLQKRTIGVFIDRFRLPKPLADPVFLSMKKLLHDAVRPGDAVTVLTWYRGHLTTLQTYTDDLAAIDRAIDTIARQNTSAMRDTYTDERRERDEIEEYELELEEFAAAGGGDASGLRAADDAMKTASARMAARRDFTDLDLKVRTINALMRSMSGFPGKRVLLLATHRLSEMAGADHYWASGGGGVIESLDRMELDTRHVIKSLYDTANANGVAIYPMFPEGLNAVPSISAEGRFPAGNVRSASEGLNGGAIELNYVAHGYEYLIQNNETPVLKEVAKQTGGLAAWGSSDVARLFNVIRDDFDSYYSLAYRATARSADKARSIVVKTRRRDLFVRSRREAIEKSDTRRTKDRIVGALFRDNDPGARLKFAVKLGDPARRGRKIRIPVTIRIPSPRSSPCRTGQRTAAHSASM